MSLITMFPEILEAGKREYEELKAGRFRTLEEMGTERNGWKNQLVLGENGAFIKALLHNEEIAGKIQMIYIDPPFFTKAGHEAVVQVDRPKEDGGTVKAKHLAYDDTWSQGIGQYLSMLTSRFMLMRDLLADEGTIWVHLDWHAVHYVRLLLDEIFGADRFVNEIVWTYKSGGASKKHFARKHDTILVYSKTKKYYFQPLKEKSYNRGYKPYHFKGVEEFPDELGWYTMVNMKDVWHIDMVGRTSSERTGYATQKPEALLARILACSTREGDLCADFFCGSGTLAAAAQKMNRRWICCDQGKLAVSATYRRIAELQDETGCCLQEDASMDSTRCLEAEISGRAVTVSGCEVLLDEGVLEKEDLQKFRQLAEEDPLQMLDCWSVDPDYDGKVHRPKQYFFRRKGKLEMTALLLDEDAGRNTDCSIVAVDVLGGRYQAVLHRERERQ